MLHKSKGVRTGKKDHHHVCITIYFGQIGGVIFGPKRRPDFLDDLSTALLEGVGDTADVFISGGIVRPHKNCSAIPFFVQPLSKGMRARTIDECRPDDKRVIFSLGKIIGPRVGNNKGYPVLLNEFSQSVGRTGSDHSSQNVNLLFLNKFASGVQRPAHLIAADVFHEHLKDITTGFVADLVHVEVETIPEIYT